MKILLLEREPSSTRGGQEHSMFAEGTGLAARGHEVTLGYSTPGDLLPRYERHGVRTVHLGDFEVRREHLLESGSSFARGLVRSLAIRPDVVVVGQYHDALGGQAIARALHRPLVCHLRLFPPETFCGQWRTGLGGVTRFIAVGHGVRRAWIERGCEEDTVDVVHDGVDTSRFRPLRADERLAWRRREGIPADAFVVASAGRIDRQKHLEEQLRSFAALGLPADRARLVIAGRPVVHESPEAGQRYLESLQSLARELGIADAVHWLGARADVPDILGAADVSALFTLFLDALPRILYESMACGTPPIAQRDGGTLEVLTGEWERFTFDARQPGSATALLRTMVGWREREPELAARLRAHAERGFSEQAMVAGVERTLDRAIADGPVRRGPSRARLSEGRAAVPLHLQAAAAGLP